MSNVTNLFLGATHSALYTKFRPIPPPVLISEIISYVKKKISESLDKAVDIGCGTGQSTQALQPYFQHIHGFDVSETQISEAKQQAEGIENLSFSISQAETLPVSSASVQLVTVSQAIHWFNLPDFFKEVDRILVPKGTLAVYCYLLPTITAIDSPDKSASIQKIIDKFYSVTLKDFWDERRYMIDDKYKDIHFPENDFTDIVRVESITDQKKILFSDYVGYIQSWSAFQQLKNQDQLRAEKSLGHTVESVMEIFGKEYQDPSEVPMTMESMYILLMGTKKY